jgi:hypothetical protein
MAFHKIKGIEKSKLLFSKFFGKSKNSEEKNEG